MKKLSELVDYRNLIDKFTLTDIHHHARHRLDGVIHKVINHPLQFNQYSNNIIADGHEIDRAFDKFASTIDNIRSHVNNLIQEQHADYLKESTRWYDQEMCFETDEYILNRRMALDLDSAELLQGRISRYADWRVPGLIFRPGLENFIEQLVPLDPLYLADQNLELLSPAVNGFTPEYQRRLRQYAIPERSNQTLLEKLPNGQFGYVFAYNYFNFKPLEVVNQYLTELWAKLRPGGVLFMTFNDCDYGHGVALSERSFMCYTPGHMILNHAENLGFELNDRHRGEGDVAWFEFQKPGDVYSLRGGQTLAKIVPK
jgi:hypothetical protein